MSNCPVCEKAGLQDFKSQHVICPQCNSDLKPYMILSRLSVVYKPGNKYIFSTLGLIIVALSIAVITLLVRERPNTLGASITESSSQNNNTDTIAELKEEVGRLKNEMRDSGAIVRYRIRQGDYPAKIASFFFNDWKRYKQIEKDNKLIQTYQLRVGQKV